MIKKVGGKFQVISHQTGKLLGTFSSRAKAEASLRNRARFSNKKGKK